jgi:D-lactate dehydrogenase (cytochrome)
MYGSVTEAIVGQLRNILGDAAVSTGESDRVTHSADESIQPPVVPDVVVYPRTTEHVSRLAALANEHRIPLTGYGAGSSVEGHTIPVHHGIVVDFRDMNRIIEVHVEDFQVTVEPGVTRLDLEAHLGRFGLFFPPDPGANATIGGMIANNAAGIRTVKHGMTRDNVLALEVVLADGRVMNTGSRSIKQSAGYDLRHLIVGSEGTLGLVTRATLRVWPIPEHFRTAMVGFADVATAAEAVYAIVGQGLAPAALELLHEDHLTWMNEDEGSSYPEVPTLMVEFTGPSEVAVADAMIETHRICEARGAVGVTDSIGREARAEMWRHRHGLRERYIRRGRGKKAIPVDVAVPISRFPDLVTYALDQVAAHGFDFPIVGHAGDGNLHIGIVLDPDDPDERARASRLDHDLIAKALEYDGTSTGEHGIGIGKRQFLVDEFGQTAVDVMRSIKQALDPNGILNPGKVLPEA